LKENHRSVNFGHYKFTKCILNIYSHAYHYLVDYLQQRSRSSKANESLLFIQVTRKNGKRTCIS